MDFYSFKTPFSGENYIQVHVHTCTCAYMYTCKYLLSTQTQLCFSNGLGVRFVILSNIIYVFILPVFIIYCILVTIIDVWITFNHTGEKDVRFTWHVREELNVKYLYVRMTGHKHAQSIMLTSGVYTSWSGYLEWNHVTGVTKTSKGKRNKKRNETGKYAK